MIRRPPRSTRTDTLFPYTTLFRSDIGAAAVNQRRDFCAAGQVSKMLGRFAAVCNGGDPKQLSDQRPRCHRLARHLASHRAVEQAHPAVGKQNAADRSDAPRVGHECVSTRTSPWSPYHEQLTHSTTPAEHTA